MCQCHEFHSNRGLVIPYAVPALPRLYAPINLPDVLACCRLLLACYCCLCGGRIAFSESLLVLVFAGCGVLLDCRAVEWVGCQSCRGSGWVGGWVFLRLWRRRQGVVCGWVLWRGRVLWVVDD